MLKPVREHFVIDGLTVYPSACNFVNESIPSRFVIFVTCDKRNFGLLLNFLTCVAAAQQKSTVFISLPSKLNCSYLI